MLHICQASRDCSFFFSCRLYQNSERLTSFPKNLILAIASTYAVPSLTIRCDYGHNARTYKLYKKLPESVVEDFTL